MKIYFIVFLFIPFVYYSWGAEPSNTKNPNTAGIYYVNHGSNKNAQEEHDDSIYPNSSRRTVENPKVNVDNKDSLASQNIVERFKTSRFIRSIPSDQFIKYIRLQNQDSEYNNFSGNSTKEKIKKLLKNSKQINVFKRKNSNIRNATLKILSIINSPQFQKIDNKFSHSLYFNYPVRFTTNNSFISKSIDRKDICKIIKNHNLNLTFVVRDCTKRKSQQKKEKSASSNSVSSDIFENSLESKSLENSDAPNENLMYNTSYPSKDTNENNKDLRTCVYTVQYQNRGLNEISNEFPEILYEVRVPKNIETTDDTLINMLGYNYLRDMEQLQLIMHKNSSLFKNRNPNKTLYIGISFIILSFILLGFLFWRTVQ